MAGDINRVTLVGSLTRDPELRHLPSGTPVLQLGLAVNRRQKDDAGNWTDKPNFFDVKVLGNQAESSRTTSKGRRVGIDGRLDWSSWEAQDGGKRSGGGDHRKQGPIPRQPRRRRRAGRANSCPRARRPRPANADFGNANDDDIPF